MARLWHGGGARANRFPAGPAAEHAPMPDGWQETAHEGLPVTAFHIASILFLTVSLLGVLNERWLRLPHSVGLAAMALVLSLGILGFDAVFPESHAAEGLRELVHSVDFEATLLDGMLCFLLFAGALQVDLAALREERWPVLILASVGVMLSTLLVGTAFHLLTGLPLVQSMVFGALISPTDPIAVVSIMRSAGAPKRLETRIVGESLLNDGVGIVAFVTATAFAFAGDGGSPGVADVAILFAREVAGGIALGLGAGWVTYRLLAGVDDAALEIMMTLALVTGVYTTADLMHVSGPLAVVSAGLLIGNRGMRFAMSDRTRRDATTFWNLLDEMLNAVLFLLIGFEVLVLSLETAHLLTLAAIPLVLAARWTSMAVPAAVASPWRDFDNRALAVLTWGGLRGGISVALALSLPEGEPRTTILTATYAVVIFSIIVQGLTIRPLLGRLGYAGRG